MQSEPQVRNGADVTFKDGEPTRIEITVRHLVDDWCNTDFTFHVDEGVAHLRSADSAFDSYHFQQNGPAREKAYEVVEGLSIISEVERLND